MAPDSSDGRLLGIAVSRVAAADLAGRSPDATLAPAAPVYPSAPTPCRDAPGGSAFARMTATIPRSSWESGVPAKSEQ